MEGGAPGEFAGAAVRALGEGAAAELLGDPWLVLGVEGVRVEADQADAFARAVLGADCGPGDERRVRALVGHLMEKAAEQGHTALGAEPLKAALARHAVPDPDAALAAAVEEAQLLVFRAESEAPGAHDDQDQDGQDEEEAALPCCSASTATPSPRRASPRTASACCARSRATRRLGAGRGHRGTASAAELITAAAHALVLHTGGEAARAEPAALVGPPAPRACARMPPPTPRTAGAGWPRRSARRPR